MLAQKWALAMATSSYLPMSFPQARDYLRDLAEQLVAALSGPSVDTQAASQVGARLVAGGFTGAQSLSLTFDVLGRGLPPPPHCGRIITLLGALAGGYTWALRNHVVDQQEEVKRAPRHVVTTVEDITDLHLLEQRLHHQALHDPQTGLPNRQYFVTHLEKVLAQVEPSAVVTLMHLDLDGFSAINDGLGHHAGDRLLDVVARRLEGVVADQRAMVARLGADEYAILIEPGDSVPDAGIFAEIINTELAEPCYIDGIGVAASWQ